VAALPGVAAVNAHARPDDEEWLCPGCYRRRNPSTSTSASCTHCGEPDADQWRGTFPFAEACGRLQEAAGILSSAGKQLFIENTCESPDLMARVLSNVPGAGFTLDTGHSMLYGAGPDAYLALLGDRLMHLHLHDNLGGDSEKLHDRHLTPGKGILDWTAFGEELRRLRFRGTAVFECSPEHLPAPEWIRDWVRLVES